MKTDIELIRDIVEKNHGEVSYVADPEALEYNQSTLMTDEDQDYIEKLYDSLEDEEEMGVALED